MYRFLFLIFCAASSPAFAQLKWENPWQEFQRDPEVEYVEATFKFTNTGATPVSVKSVKTSCGCTTAEMAKKTYLPGETGVVTANFHFGDRVGAQRKIVTVKTVDGISQDLNIVVYIHRAMTLTPSLVYWKKAQDALPQAVTLNTEPGQVVHVTRVTSPNPRFAVQLETVTEGAQYRVLIAPTSTVEKDKAEITVQTDYPPDAPRAYTIYARIK